MCLVMRHHEITHDDGEEVELYCTEQWAKIISEGEKEGFFNAVEERRIEIDDHKGETEEEREPMQQEILRMAAQNTLTTDDIDVATNLVQTDNDNEPAPENIPSSNDGTDKILNDEWGHDGFCVRRMTNIANANPKIIFPHNVEPTLLQVFELLFCKQYVEEVLIPATNEKLESELTYGEFLVWLGLWLLMATIQGPARREFWSTHKVDLYEGAPFRLNDVMTRNRFESILSSLRYTNIPPPSTKTDFMRSNR